MKSADYIAGMRHAADLASMFSIENRAIHPDIEAKDMGEAAKIVYHTTCQQVAYHIRDTADSLTTLPEQNERGRE